MHEAKQVFNFLQPSLSESRGNTHLLIWGDLAHWMIVDDELNEFIQLFNGCRPLKNVLRAHAKRRNKSIRDVENEAMPVVEDLLRRGILSKTKAFQSVKSEPVSIANVTVNLTNRCNLQCKWCYNSGRNTDEMPIEEMMAAIDRGRSIFEPNASFIILGGEPMLDIPRLLGALDSAENIFSPPVMVSTNGTLLSSDVVEAIRQRRVEIQVSLDSYSEDRHDAIRGKGVFKKAVDGIRRLVDAEVYTIISMVYSDDNYMDFEPYLDLAIELGVNEARFIPMRMIGSGTEFRDQAPRQDIVFKHLLDVLEKRPELRSLLKRDFFSIMMTICRQSSSRCGCGIGRRVVFIDADGLVYPCPNHVQQEYACGDLKKENLEEIIVGSPVMTAMRDRYHVDHYTQCRTCTFRYWCAGDCRGEVLATAGDPLAPSPHCQELQDVIKEMLWLTASNDERLCSLVTPNAKSAEDTFLT